MNLLLDIIGILLIPVLLLFLIGAAIWDCQIEKRARKLEEKEFFESLERQYNDSTR